MAVDSEAEHPSPPAPAGPARPVSRAIVICYWVAGTLLLGWFLFGWLVLRQGFVDSVGESLGTGFALLLVAAVVGTVRRSRR